MELISIIMPAYNAEKYIAESIESVLSQSYSNIELVIVNDGSNDNTCAVIDEYASKHTDKIRFINKEKNEGTALTLNRAILESKGSYICWLSADDLFVKDTVESLVNYLKLHQEYDMVFSDFELIDGNSNFLRNSFFKKDLTELIEQDKHQPYKGLLISGCIINGCTVIIPKKCFNNVGGFNPKYRYAHDYEMWLKLASQYCMGYLNKVNVKNRTYPEQISQLGRNEIDALHALFDFLENEDFYPELFRKADIQSNLDGVFYVLDKLLSFYKHREGEFKTLYQLSLNYISEFERRNNHIVENARVTNFMKKCELISENPSLTKQSFFEENHESNYLHFLSKALQLDGFIANRKAIRFDRFQGNDISRLNNGLMRYNNIVICYFNKDELDSLIKDRGNEFWYSINKSNKQIYEVGITYYMLYDPTYKGLFENCQTKVTDEDIWSTLIDTIIKEDLVLYKNICK